MSFCEVRPSLVLLAALAVAGPAPSMAEGAGVGTAASGMRSAYLMGPDDQVVIWALGVEEISDKPVRIDPQGYVDLPMVGHLKLAGLTVEQAKAELSAKLAAYVREPKVSLSISEFRSQPVSVLGAVNAPGLQQLQGRKSLVEMLSMAGGLRPDAGYSVRITRQLAWGRIPLPSAVEDATGQFSVAEVRTRDLIDASHPEQNIQILPNDVIAVPKTDQFYVVGDVHKAGGFSLEGKETVSVLQALSVAQGLMPTASGGSARILRSTSASADRIEIPVDIKKVLNGKDKEAALKAGDILYVPSSMGKKVTTKAIETSLGIGTGVLVWRR